MNSNDAKNLAPKAARDNYATQLMNLGKDVLEFSATTRDRVSSKLATVTRPHEDGKESTATPIPQWPPLLSDLRTLFQDIRDNLKAMNETMDRLEI